MHMRHVAEDGFRHELAACAQDAGIFFAVNMLLTAIAHAHCATTILACTWIQSELAFKVRQKAKRFPSLMQCKLQALCFLHKCQV